VSDGKKGNNSKEAKYSIAGRSATLKIYGTKETPGSWDVSNTSNSSSNSNKVGKAILGKPATAR
jgi:hypothetical protein